MIFKKSEITRETLLKAVLENNGKARKRILSESEVDTFLSELEKLEEGYSLAVYSKDGFVPNSYNFPASIAGIRYNYKTQNIQISWYGAKRPGGIGSLVVSKKYDFGF